MGLHCHQRFVTVGETAITIHGEEIAKWSDEWNEALGYLRNEGKVKPLFPMRGQHEDDLPDTDDDNWGHNWLTLDEIINADYSQPVIGACGVVVCPSWAEYLGFDPSVPDDEEDDYKHYRDKGATLVFYHFNR